MPVGIALFVTAELLAYVAAQAMSILFDHYSRNYSRLACVTS